jgi:hypothetical protein
MAFLTRPGHAVVFNRTEVRGVRADRLGLAYCTPEHAASDGDERVQRFSGYCWSSKPLRSVCRLSFDSTWRTRRLQPVKAVPRAIRALTTIYVLCCRTSLLTNSFAPSRGDSCEHASDVLCHRVTGTMATTQGQSWGQSLSIKPLLAVYLQGR